MISSPPARENGDVIVCPESSLSLTCSHNNVEAEQTRWEVSSYGEDLIPRVASHEPNADKSQSFGPFSFTMISNGSGPTLTSTVVATVTDSLNGTVVLCKAGGLNSSTVEGRVTVHVVGMYMMMIVI